MRCDRRRKSDYVGSVFFECKDLEELQLGALECCEIYIDMSKGLLSIS